MAHPEAHQCETKRQGQHFGELTVREDGSKVCAAHENIKVRRCLINEPGTHRGLLGEFDVCQFHARCVVPEPGTHGGERLHMVDGELRCENHGGSSGDPETYDVVAKAEEVLRDTQERQPVLTATAPPTSRSEKNIPQRGRPRKKKRSR